MSGLSLLLLATLHHGSHAETIEGYVSDQSVAQGESIGFCVSTDAPSFDLRIHRQGVTWELMRTVEGIPGQQLAVPDSAFWYGCDWPLAYVLDVPADWPSGVYIGQLVTPDALGYAIFAVREDEPGSTSRILFTTCENTWQAYNGWGGKSLYGFNSANGQPSVKVSFDRPYAEGGGKGRFNSHGASHFIRWATMEGYELDYAANADLHRDPDLLSHYDLYLSVGHDEYWSFEMREQLEAFRDAGGNIGVFSANSIYWQVRFENDMRLMTCYKDSLSDPLYGIDNQRVTTLWRAHPVHRPEAALIGVQHFPNGCCCGDPDCRWQGQPAAIVDPGHWIFENAGVGPGDSLGTIVLGWEWDNTVPGATPPWAEVVMEAWPLDGRGIPNLFQAVYFQAGGKVFAGGTVQWGLGLTEWWGRGYADKDVQQVTRNVLAELLIPGVAAVADEPGATAPTVAALRVCSDPVSSRVRVELDIPRDARVLLDLHDVMGRSCGRYLDRELAAGTHRTAFVPRPGGRRLPSGIYFLRSNLTGVEPVKLLMIR